MPGIWFLNFVSSVASPLTASAMLTRWTRLLKMPREEITEGVKWGNGGKEGARRGLSLKNVRDKAGQLP